MHAPASLTLTMALLLGGSTLADEPRPVPLTRPEMKQLLEDMKTRKPRIPLPELTEAERAKLGDREPNYENRLRTNYLPEGWGFGGPGGGNRPGAAAKAATNPAPAFGRNADANMTLDYAFKTELFWIVSRTNNCQYCLGHQESKLLAAGLDEPTIAALDGDWSGFDPAHRAAFAFARKLTYEPDRLTDADIAQLREHYTDLQILEMVLSVAGNNAINRWKEGAGIPQIKDGGNFGRRNVAGALAAEAGPAEHQSYLTPTPEAFRSTISRVAPIVDDPATGQPSRKTLSRRPPLESTAEVDKALEAARHRAPRLPLVGESEARAVVSDLLPEGPLPEWVRLVTNFPREGLNRVTSIKSAEAKGDLEPLLKAQAAWIVARQDRAWYALGLSKRRLKELGQSADQIAALDGDWSGFAPADRAMFTLARKLAASPVVLTDADVAEAVKLTSPRDVTQLISYITTRASFDRITEAAGLRLED
jgi:alkylhydroperoxidase family enzyme